MKNKVKKYQINPPKKCQNCEKASKCEYFKNSNQKPFDSSAVLLDCKAFYKVFIELEELCCVPFGNHEKMKKYREENFAEKYAYLTPALVTNGMLAAELALKAITLKETGMFDCIHNIDKLFYALPNVDKSVLSKLIIEKANQNEATLKINLKTISNFFVEWRYSFQNEVIGYADFLLKFIHIVCDYAIVDNKNDITDEE